MSPLQVPPNCDLTLGLSCVEKSTPGTTRWEMVADERFSNPAGLLQGGILSAFIDSAMGASVVTFEKARSNRPIVVANTELHTSFLKAVPAGARLVCEATVVSAGERVCFVEASVHDARGRLVARASSTYLVAEAATAAAHRH